ncbi:hypothetical protein [Halovivax limisalsi]|uniref:hypothetical protein n=1 Tax=Halovivax limisalsi TaxID=1453760 RepID=UPI001FFDCD09|nr:hypothetical protein [Halovivax limisalsi]
MSVVDEEVSAFVENMTSTYNQKMTTAVRENFTDDYFDSLGGPEAVMKKQFPAQAWREFYNGTLPPARQMTQVYELGEPYGRDRDIIVGLGKQLSDEVKHARILANLSEELGTSCDLATWEGENYDKFVSKCRTTTEWDEPHHIAAGLQCSTEIIAARTLERIGEYVEDDYPDITASLRDIAADEGDHIHVGRLIMKRFASPDELDTLDEIAERKYDAAVSVLESL